MLTRVFLGFLMCGLVAGPVAAQTATAGQGSGTATSGRTAGQNPRQQELERRGLLVPVVGAAAFQGAATSQLRGFSIVLVQGDVKGTNDTAAVPAAALKAMADLKDFLPYKSYQHLDTQWILGSGRLATRLQRPGQVYDVEMEVATGPGASRVISVSRFVVKESQGAPAVPAELEASSAQASAEHRLQSAVAMMRDVRAKFEIGIASRRAVDEAEEAVAASEQRLLEAQLAAARAGLQVGRSAVIDSSFKMNVGETLVVGTSKIPGATAGDRALIVILTAVGK